MKITSDGYAFNGGAIIIETQSSREANKPSFSSVSRFSFYGTHSTHTALLLFLTSKGPTIPFSNKRGGRGKVKGGKYGERLNPVPVELETGQCR